jgi:hypothetical protein
VPGRLGARQPVRVLAALQADAGAGHVGGTDPVHSALADGRLRALRLEFDDRPEPVVEVAAPEGYGNRDISADLAGES